jgi:hypothetical protein
MAARGPEGFHLSNWTWRGVAGKAFSSKFTSDKVYFAVTQFT